MFLPQDDPNLSLSMANRIFVNEKYRVKTQFRTQALEFFRASPESMDFEAGLGTSIQRINQWVETRTNGKITDLMQPGSIHAATKVVLVNAVYFQARFS